MALDVVLALATHPLVAPVLERPIEDDEEVCQRTHRHLFLSLSSTMPRQTHLSRARQTTRRVGAAGCRAAVRACWASSRSCAPRYAFPVFVYLTAHLAYLFIGLV